MTMHLVGPYMTTTNYKKKKRSKITAGKMKAYETDLRAYNKSMKRIGSHNMQMTMDEYIDYRQGNYKPKVNPNYRPPSYEPPQARETPDYPSLSNNLGGSTAKKESMKYTGERKLLGIATMHKSNMVPVFADNKEEAVEIARMRR